MRTHTLDATPRVRADLSAYFKSGTSSGLNQHNFAKLGSSLFVAQRYVAETLEGHLLDLLYGNLLTLTSREVVAFRFMVSPDTKTHRKIAEFNTEDARELV